MRYGFLFGYPDVGRYGLGHGLMAWARCVVWCEKTGARMIAPIWLRPRIGPYLRRERDKREYFRLFHHGDQISGVGRAYCLTFMRHYSAQAFRRLQNSPNDSAVVIFRNDLADNLPKHFPEIIARHELIHRTLRAITRTRYLPPPLTEPYVAVHVRLGDFTPNLSKADLVQGANNSQLPSDWYVEMLQGVRRRLGRDVPAIVYSDGSDADLATLLALPAVVRSPNCQSITDMLSIAQSTLLISSGSGFSIWGAFLGQVPRICFPGQRKVRVLLPHAAGEIEPECEDSDGVPSSILEAVEPSFIEPARSR